DVGGVHALLRLHVADVRGVDVEITQPKWLEGPAVDVGHVRALDAKVIHLERVDRLQRVLPAALLYRRGIGDLGAGLGEVDVKGGTIDEEITDQSTVEERAPVHAGAEQGNARHGRVRVRVLHHDQLGDVEGETDRVEVELADVRGVALEGPIHLRLG